MAGSYVAGLGVMRPFRVRSIVLQLRRSEIALKLAEILDWIRNPSGNFLHAEQQYRFTM